MPIVSYNRPKQLEGKYDLRGSYRLVCSTGAVTTIAARTATAGQLFNFRWPATATVGSHKAWIKRVAAKFITTTAYGTAQETAIDMILAHSFTVNGTNGTAVDVGSTVANTGKMSSGFSDSLITAGCVRVGDTAAITAGTHTLDANPFAILSGYSSGVGITVPSTGSGAADGMGVLFDANISSHYCPVELAADQGFILRNVIVMGASGVGRWDFLVEWDEGIPA